jgi:two-component system, sensor histidine kinase and response regulator
MFMTLWGQTGPGPGEFKVPAGIAIDTQNRIYVTEIGNHRVQAFDSHGKFLFDLVLMAVQMPDLDGFETTAAIREQERTTGAHLPILALTAHAMGGDHERCLAAGMDGYLPKPLKADDLEAAIDRLLG